MKRTVLVRAVFAACLLSVSTASLVAAAPIYGPAPIYQQTRYVVDGIYQQYETTGGFYSTGMGCVGPCSTGISTSYSWSNSWSATIGFSKAPIDASAQFDTGSTGSLTYTHSFPIPSGKSGVIWYADYYLVKKMNVHTETCWPNGSGCTYKYGTATAKQWLKRLYSVRLS